MNSHFYKPNIMIIGPSGSGKSSAYEHLPDEETAILHPECKGFPFRKKFTNVFNIETAQEFYPTLENILKLDKVKYIVVDSHVKHLENCLNFCRGAYKGYDIWSNYNFHIRNSINRCKSREKIFIVVTHDELTEIVAPDGSKTNKRCAATLAGREWDGKLEKEFLIVLFTDVRKNPKFDGGKNGEPAMLYQFMTNNDGICTAKSPAGMFKELYIPNDISKVVARVEEYYK